MLKDNFKRNYIFISIVFSVLLIIPFLIRLFTTPEGMFFNWFLYNDVDYDTYLMKINAFKYYDTIEYISRFSYDKITNTSGFLFVFYSIPGFLFNLIGIENTNLIFNLLKIFVLIFFFVVFYKFLITITKSNKERYWILFLTLLFNAHEELIFYNISKGVILESMLNFPHHLFENTLVLISWMLVWKFKNKKWKYSVYNGVCLLLISLIHPQVAVLNGLVQGCYVVYQILKEKRSFKDLLPVTLWGLLPLPYLLSLVIEFSNNSTLGTWANKNSHEMLPLEILISILICVISVVLLIINKKKFKNYDFLPFMISISILNLIPNNWQHYFVIGSVWCFYIIFGLSLANTNFKLFRNIIVGVIVISFIFTLIFQPLLCRNDVDEFVVYVPDFYNDIVLDFENIDEPVSILAQPMLSSYLLGHTKHFLPLTGSKDESKNYNECLLLLKSMVEHNSLQQVIDNGHLDYVVVAKDYPININDGEKYILKQTADYIIYKIN